MILLFEDKEEDELSSLLRRSFNTDKFQFMYSNGNGRLLEKATELLNGKDTIVVLLDTIPENKSIRDIYMALRRLSRQNDFRIIVWNIVCAEYYFIKAFGEDKHLKAFYGAGDINIIKRKRPYKESKLISTEEDRAFTKTFEKFCKLYIMKNGGDCVKKSKIFFSEDCTEDVCRNLMIEEKAELYKREYKCFELDRFGIEVAWNVHHKLLAESNQMIEEYNNSLGYKKIQIYPPIIEYEQSCFAAK